MDRQKPSCCPPPHSSRSRRGGPRGGGGAAAAGPSAPTMVQGAALAPLRGGQHQFEAQDLEARLEQLEPIAEWPEGFAQRARERALGVEGAVPVDHLISTPMLGRCESKPKETPR